MSRYKDAKTPPEKLLRNPVGKSEGKAGGDRPSLGRPGPVPEPPEACQRHFRGRFLGVGDLGTRGVHGASGASQHLGGVWDTSPGGGGSMPSPWGKERH